MTLLNPKSTNDLALEALPEAIRKSTPARRLTGSHELAIAVLTVGFIIVFGFVDPRYLAPGNLIDILRQTAVIAILAFAMTAVIVTRGIDMSVGGTLALAGMALGIVYQTTGSWGLSALAALATGSLVGVINGIVVGIFGISAFLATFAMLAVTRAASLLVSGSSSIIVPDPIIIWIGQGDLFGIPSSVLILLAMLGAWTFLMRSTRLGRYLFAVGNSPGAAAASLLPVSVILTSAYLLSGLSAGIGAVLTVGRLGSAQPLAGAGVEFAALTAAVIGGSRLSGGKGSILGTFMGALLLACLSAGLSFMQISQQMTYVVTGLLIIVAFLITDADFRVRVRSFASAFWRRASAPRTHTNHFGEVIAGALRETVQLVGISKSYAGVQALTDVSFSIASGEVLALLGENGAGKSTLVKCLSGGTKPDAGSVIVGRENLELAQLKGGIGCSTVHQHFSLAPDLSLIDNLVAIDSRGFWAFRQRKQIREKIRAIRQEFDLDINAEDPVGRLTVGQRQIAEIVKALVEGKWLIILDEPTSALSVRERDALFRVLAQLKQKAVAIIYISHKLEEIFAISDRILVLRDGQCVGEVATEETSEALLIQMMVGRKIEAVFPYLDVTQEKPVLVVEGLSDGRVLRNASFTVNHGEIIGIAGLMGSGRSELLRCIAGISSRTAGAVQIRGRDVPPGDPIAAQRHGLAYVPEDRLADGIFPDMSMLDNLTMCWLSGAGFVLQRQALMAEGQKWVEQLDIRPNNLEMRVGGLSGGNQQKVVLGKYLALCPSVLLLDEPTQGVDIGAKSEIHKRIGQLKQAGAAIVMVSSELPELLAVADRVLVMAKGQALGPLPHGSSQEAVMELALRTSPQAHA
jgi:ribose transport system ATP-binding protein